MFVFIILFLFSFFSPILALSSDVISSEIISTQYTKKTIPLLSSNPFWTNFWMLSFNNEFTIYPQKTIRLNDKTSNQELEKSQPEKFQVKVAYNDNEIGIWIEWKDSTETRLNQEETTSFGDTVAIEIPQKIPKKFGNNFQLPYIGMGDEQAPVFVSMQRSTEKGIEKNEYVAKGFGTLTRIQNKISLKMNMEYNKTTQSWQAVFIQKNLKQGLIPIAFAFWDGARSERGGNKYISSWKFLKLTKYKIDSDSLKEISFGLDSEKLNNRQNIQKGKDIFITNCSGCHQTESKKTTNKLAPNLSNIGGIATYPYLRDSIVNPNLVIIKNPQALNKDYQWYTIDSSGKKISKMPKFDFSSETLNDLIAYLKSLRGT